MTKSRTCWSAIDARWAARRPAAHRAPRHKPTLDAYCSYASGDRRFEVNLLLGMQTGMTWMPDYQEGFKLETPEGIMEVKRINGCLVFHTCERDNNTGGIVVLSGRTAQPTPRVCPRSFRGVNKDHLLKAPSPPANTGAGSMSRLVNLLFDTAQHRD